MNLLQLRRYAIDFAFYLISSLITLNFIICIKSFFSSILSIIEFSPTFFSSLVIQGIVTFFLILPIKKNVTLLINNQKHAFGYCGGLVSLFKLHGSTKEFDFILKDIDLAKGLIKQDLLFLENKNNNVEERCALLRDARNMEQYLGSHKPWQNLVNRTTKDWNIKDASGNTNIIYNSFLEKEVFNGSSSFFLQHNFATTYLQTIPAQFKNILGNRTPDIIATKLNATSITSANLFDVKGILRTTHPEEILSLLIVKPNKDLTNTMLPDLTYRIIHHGLTPHEKLTQIILNNSQKIQNTTLVYCPRLDTTLEAQTKNSPLTGTPSEGWFNFESGIFKPFKDIIIP